ncbi:MAG TPA: hypothetical protein PK440_09180 [Candidatus Accumulibacter phosphatis]|nr:MAG: hypothetical protein AW07_00758 [Candidatus Accumulibacter sp. SK-11]HAY26192.1 hypothetical protein [Accumulibacter sp.]HCV12287.1 hypothetical protein [Accumulibacter sp.]HRL74431.1 hypothetical protein [Candidatus Accumulibacter phosphatis]HRQ95157.1 hypothetical protein [Candidatus Accumulibacter phosphatis]
MQAPHLFVDISAHGFGHLAQAAPVINMLAARVPMLRLTIRSGLPRAKLDERLNCAFSHLEARSDFGYVMLDAMRVDLPATALAYRRQHADWARTVDEEASFLVALQPTLVLSDVAYLPLAGAARAGIPSVALCSLNWAELFAHFFAAADWAPQIHQQMLAAYNGAEFFLRLTPGMPMADLRRRRCIGPVAALGVDRRQALRQQLDCPADERLVLIAFGGIDTRLPVADWPPLAGIRWLVPQAWRLRQANTTDFEPLGLPMIDLLRSVDAVIAKPGYGTFAEAACNATPLLYVRRQEWPEQDCLIEWLHAHACCAGISDADLRAGHLQAALAALWQRPQRQPPRPTGADEAVTALLPWLVPGGTRPGVRSSPSSPP